MTTEQAIISGLGALITLLLGIIAYLYNKNSTSLDKRLATIEKSIKEGLQTFSNKLDKITTDFFGINERVALMEKDCKEIKKDIDISFNQLREVEKRLSDIEKNCIAKHGNNSC